ncbi:flagellar basal body rod protein FlgB [Undibacterium seohonense]|uniref:Flagellar basal body rod protein FlgB n=1 Tax=Undibacterium seohonense TaxID=1344950 RepID=A0ABR6X6W9_9BURK|nr:flagellar basal body rod protein FlgB [Undibacterium seohonense]MBC3808672.1 flagellar basal body rod protein FlgB [Undibacterium seohonense]
MENTVNKLDDYMRFHQLALSVRGQRQQLLASNIANADTPNYKARDIDFGSAMSAALGKTGAARDLSKTAAAHFSQAGTVAGLPPAYRKEVQGNIDGNTVDMDVERNAFTENALKYEASLTLINMQIKGLLSAIQG